MSEPLPELDQVFDEALLALAPASEAAVAIGGWAIRLLRGHELATELPHEPLLTTDLDVALATEDASLGDALHESLESAGFKRELQGDEKPPVSAHLRQTVSGPVKVEFLTTRKGGATRRDGQSNRTRDVGGLTVQCFPTIRLLLLEPWSVRRSIRSAAGDAEVEIEVRVPNPTALIFEKLLIIETRKTLREQAKDLLYIAELLSAFADSMNVLLDLARDVVRPELKAKENKRIAKRIECLTATSDIVLAAATEAGQTGRTQWASAASLADTLEAGLTALMEA